MPARPRPRQPAAIGPKGAERRLAPTAGGVAVFRSFHCKSAAWLAALALAVVSIAPPAASRARATEMRSLDALVRANVKYVFVIYQENRSFDSYFGTFPGAEGLFSHAPALPPGFEQPILDTDGTTSSIRPFRIGPAQYASDTDDVDHSHTGIVAKMDIVDGTPRMDRFALTEERRFSPSGNPSLMAKQFGELTMAYEDCDTVPFLWHYADRFALFDHVYQLMTGPSTPGNLSIIAAQTGITQRILHPDEAAGGANGDSGAGVPVLDDSDPFWGSPSDPTTARKLPVNPADFPGYGIQRNLTFATLPLTLTGGQLADAVKTDRDSAGDLRDVGDDVAAISRRHAWATPWAWYEEGYDREPSNPDDGPETADGRHAAYVTHHNGPQYFGYVANNPAMTSHLHGLDDFRRAIDRRALPSGGVFYLKGGYRNLLGLKPADPDVAVQTRFVGDDDHPAYSDSQISEAMVADLVNRIARSPYWKQSAIVLTWDDSEGDYDHVVPRIRHQIPGEAPESDGPRVPLIVISPFAKMHAVVHDIGDQASVVKLVDTVFGLPPLQELPNEKRAADMARSLFGDGDFGPVDADGRITGLLSAFDRDRLSGIKPPIPPSVAIVPDALIRTLPQQTGYGCQAIGVTPVDRAMQIENFIPADFNPRPKTNPSAP
jgi:phospholipase C